MFSLNDPPKMVHRSTMLPDDIGDLVAIGVIAVGLGIMFYYYYIKPSK